MESATSMRRNYLEGGSKEKAFVTQAPKTFFFVRNGVGKNEWRGEAWYAFTFDRSTQVHSRAGPRNGPFPISQRETGEPNV